MFEVSGEHLKIVSLKPPSEFSETCQNKRLNYDWFGQAAAALSQPPFSFLDEKIKKQEIKDGVCGVRLRRMCVR